MEREKYVETLENNYTGTKEELKEIKRLLEEHTKLILEFNRRLSETAENLTE